VTYQADRPLAGHLQLSGAGGADRLLAPGSRYRIGRDPLSDVVLADPRVSWQHAVVEDTGSGWVLQDAGSTNGTYIEGQRVHRVTITGHRLTRLGHPDNGPVLAWTPAGELAGGDRWLPHRAAVDQGVEPDSAAPIEAPSRWRASRPAAGPRLTSGRHRRSGAGSDGSDHPSDR
jgi:hypothetical protein